METTEDRDYDYEHFFGKVRSAMSGGHRAWSVQSTGEKLAVALVLNRPEWLAEMNYTLAEAIERVGPTWIAMLPRVARAAAESGGA